MTTHSHGRPAELHYDVCEPRRHDVRLLVQFVKENLAVAELVQRRVWIRSTHRRDEEHVPQSMCRLSEGVQLVLTPVEIHVDGMIVTGIKALRKIGDIRVNQWRPRRDDETAVDVHVFELVRLAASQCWMQLNWKQRSSHLQCKLCSLSARRRRDPTLFASSVPTTSSSR